MFAICWRRTLVHPTTGPELQQLLELDRKAMLRRLRDLARVVAILPSIELARRQLGPAAIVGQLRSRAARQKALSETDRRGLRAAIESIDARIPGGPNCYRRALLEMALDPAAAREPLHMGLDASGAPRSGHAWLGALAQGNRSYDAVISL